MVWAKKSQDMTPFLVSIRPNGERWQLVEYNKRNTEISSYYVFQEALLNKFVHNWFLISDNNLLNDANWANCSGNPDVCNDNVATDVCSIYCTCDKQVFNSFETVVLPVYKELTAMAVPAVWEVKELSITPITEIKKSGGNWQLDILVTTNTGVIKFVGYAKTSYDSVDKYPKTMGYYVSDFNTYRMSI